MVVRRRSGHNVSAAFTAHAAFLSVWQSVHAFGIANAAEFSGAGMLIVWSRIVVLMLTTSFGMWHSTQRLPALVAACFVWSISRSPMAVWQRVHSALLLAAVSFGLRSTSGVCRSA